MNCPSCTARMRVTNSRALDSLTIWRTYICLECTWKFHSFEKLDPLKVEKGYRNSAAIIERLKRKETKCGNLENNLELER